MSAVVVSSTSAVHACRVVFWAPGNGGPGVASTAAAAAEGSGCLDLGIAQDLQCLSHQADATDGGDAGAEESF